MKNRKTINRPSKQKSFREEVLENLHAHTAGMTIGKKLALVEIYEQWNVEMRREASKAIGALLVYPERN